MIGTRQRRVASDSGSDRLCGRALDRYGFGGRLASSSELFDLETIVGGIRPWGGLARRIVGRYVPSPRTPHRCTGRHAIAGDSRGCPAVPVPTCETALVAVPGLDEVLPVNVVLGTSGTPIHVSGAYGIGISPDAQTAWVVGNHATAPYWTVAPIDLATGESGTVIPLDAFLQGGPISNPVVTPDGKHLLIGTANFLTTIDLATSTIDPVIAYPPPFHGAQVAVTRRRNSAGRISVPGSPGDQPGRREPPARWCSPGTGQVTWPSTRRGPRHTPPTTSATRSPQSSSRHCTPTPISQPAWLPGLIAIDPEGKGKVAVITTNSGIGSTGPTHGRSKSCNPQSSDDSLAGGDPRRSCRPGPSPEPQPPLIPSDLTARSPADPCRSGNARSASAPSPLSQAPVAGTRSAAPAPAGQPSPSTAHLDRGLRADRRAMMGVRRRLTPRAHVNPNCRSPLPDPRQLQRPLPPSPT